MPLCTTVNSHFGSDLEEENVSRDSRFMVAASGGSVPVRVAVESRRRAVGGPSGVRDAAVRVKDLGHVDLGAVDELLELGHLADLFESKDFIFLVAVDRETGRVVSSVLETGEA